MCKRLSRRNSVETCFEGRFWALTAHDMLSVNLFRKLPSPALLGRFCTAPAEIRKTLYWKSWFRASPRKSQKNKFEFYVYVCLFIYIKIYTSVLVSPMPQSFPVLIFDIRTPKFSLFLCHSPLGWPACVYPCIRSSSLPYPHLAEEAKGNSYLGPGREVLSARWWRLA